MIKAVIFDVDGTLVDSVDLHARSWQEALAHFGKREDYERVRYQIGKGGDQLMPVFLSREELDEFGEKLEEYRGELFKRDYLPRVDIGVLALEVDGGEIRSVSSVVNPEKLAHLGPTGDIRQLLARSD